MKFNSQILENTVKGTYEEMTDAFDKAVGGLENRTWTTYGGDIIEAWALFSMYGECEGDEDSFLYPDFFNEEPLVKGAVMLRINDWKERTAYRSNPTLADVLRFFANNHDGHHGFLESINWNSKSGVIELDAGS